MRVSAVKFILGRQAGCKSFRAEAHLSASGASGARGRRRPSTVLYRPSRPPGNETGRARRSTTGRDPDMETLIGPFDDHGSPRAGGEKCYPALRSKERDPRQGEKSRP